MDQFTVATIDGKFYLQTGGLTKDVDALRLFQSILDGSVGFLQDNRRISVVRITAPYDANKGIRLERLPALTETEDYVIRFTQARPGRDAASQFQGFLDPFPESLSPRYYGALLPFSEYALEPFPNSLDDRFYSELLGVQANREPESARDILNLFDGVPEQVGDYIWNLIMDRVPDPTADATYDLIRSQIEAYVTGYTEAFTSVLRTKLVNIEDRATRDQTGTEIVAEIDGELGNTRWKTERVTADTVLAAIKALTDAQDGEARTALSVAPSVHNHDDRYYTEAEADGRYARRTHNHDGRYMKSFSARTQVATSAPSTGRDTDYVLQIESGDPWNRYILFNFNY